MISSSLLKLNIYYNDTTENNKFEPVLSLKQCCWKKAIYFRLDRFLITFSGKRTLCVCRGVFKFLPTVTETSVYLVLVVIEILSIVYEIIFWCLAITSYAQMTRWGKVYLVPNGLWIVTLSSRQQCLKDCILVLTFEWVWLSSMDVAGKKLLEIWS